MKPMTAPPSPWSGVTRVLVRKSATRQLLPKDGASAGAGLYRQTPASWAVAPARGIA